jgi:5-methyltetrahydropteroyltriglutamate--homocysteine methyltransferase
MTATAKRNPPFRAEHVGSLLRPKELTRAFHEVSDGSMTAEAFREVQDRAIRDVVAMQEEIGLQAVTDGEFRRASYWAHFVEAVDGLSVRTSAFTFHDASDEQQEFLAPHLSGRLSRGQSASAAEFSFLKSATKVTPKITMPSPPTMHFWDENLSPTNDIYDDLDAFFADLARIYREEIAELAGLGARYIQIDEVPLAMLCDATVREAVRSRGADPEDLIGRYIRLINDSLADRPENMTFAMHVCRGNFKGQWLSEGGYEAVAERIFSEIQVDALFLEYDTPRAGDFAPLRFVSDDKTVVLGLITSKTGDLEAPDNLRRRIDEATQYMPLERLALSPQCGFASTVKGNPVTLDDEKNKLRLVVDVAASVWR